MHSIDIYNDSAIILNKKSPNKLISWITILFVLLILLIIFSFVPFNIYKNYYGYIFTENNYSYINISLQQNDFPINKSNHLYIDNEKYNYEIISIEQKKLTMKVNLKDEIKIDNNIIYINIFKERTTIFKIIKNKLKKGLGL